MSAIYRSIKSTYRQIAPGFAHDYIFGGRSWISRTILKAKLYLESQAGHDDIYDAAYYDRYAEEVAASALQIVGTIKEVLVPSSAIDVGCGSGEMIECFIKAGIPARGMDLSDAALAACASRGLDVAKFDLEDLNVSPPSWSADIVVSTEVAEHIPASCADRYVSILVQMANNHIVITAAPPGQGGTDHVNEQPYIYWINKFERAGARYSEILTAQFRNSWGIAGVESSRAKNVLVFMAR
jgi:SAM-dependent methyltransferase